MRIALGGAVARQIKRSEKDLRQRVPLLRVGTPEFESPFKLAPLIGREPLLDGSRDGGGEW